VTQGRYEGWVGGGWAEDMEGRSGLTLLLHTPVLSLTLVYIIFLVCSSQQLRCRTRTGSHQERPHTGHGRHRCDFFIIRKELGKGGGSGIIRVPGYFLFFFRIRDVYPVSNKILNYLSSEVIKKILVNFQRIIELFVYGPGIRNKPIPDPGSRGQKGTLSRIRIRIKSIRIRIRGEGGGC